MSSAFWHMFPLSSRSGGLNSGNSKVEICQSVLVLFGLVKKGNDLSAASVSKGDSEGAGARDFRNTVRGRAC
jgi:hypothetical protein